MNVSPLIPTRFVFLALALGAGLQGAALFLPSPWSTVAVALGAVALYLGGKGWKAPAWASARPMLPAALVPLALGAAAILPGLGSMLPPEVSPYVGHFVGFLLLLAGKVEPVPMTSTASTALADGLQASGVLQAAPAECSLADAERGLCK